MSSFVVDNYKAMFSALSVSFDAGNGSVKEDLKPSLLFSPIFVLFGI